MGSIRNLKEEKLNTHLFLSNSSLAEMYVYDVLKEKSKANMESIYTINSKKTFDSMLELVNVQPFLSDKWLFMIEFGKVKRTLKDRMGIFRSDTSEFLIKVKNYKEFKEAKELLSPVSDVVNDIYLSFIRFYDVEFLLRDYELSDKLISYVYKSYSSDPEQVFTLLKELKAGNKFTSRKQITELCGVSAGTLNSFALSLLKGEPKGERGTKTVIKNRIKVANELVEVYGYSKMRNFLLASVKDILDIKLLYLNGIIYDRISGLPDIEVPDKNGEMVPVYDEKRLSRYKMHLDTIKEIPYEKILRLYLMLKGSGKWYKDSDMVDFIYNYYMKGDA